MMGTKFKYLDQVIITDGFYEGQQGKLVDCYSDYLMAQDGSGEATHRYSVELSKNKTVSIDENMLDFVDNTSD